MTHPALWEPPAGRGTRQSGAPLTGAQVRNREAPAHSRWRGQRSGSCLSPSFKGCSGPLSSWPRRPRMTFLRAPPTNPGASNTHLQARGPGWPHGSLISLESGDKREKEKVNLVGLLGTLSYKRGKGWTAESPPGPREMAHWEPAWPRPGQRHQQSPPRGRSYRHCHGNGPSVPSGWDSPGPVAVPGRKVKPRRVWEQSP